MSKTTLVAILFSVAILGVLIYSSMGLSSYSCEVCITFQGRNNCSTASAPSEEEAIRTASDVACAPISSGMTESIQCGNTSPSKIECSRGD